MVIKIILTILAFILFFIIFGKLIKKNDTNYVYILLLQALGITVEFLEIITDSHFSIWVMVIMYILSIVLPIALYIIEKKWINLSEMIACTKAKLYEMQGKDEKARKILLKYIDKYPNSYIMHKYLASIYEKNKKVDIAIDEYIKTVEINKQDYQSYFKVANLLNEVNRKEQAKDMLYELLRKNPKYYEATMLLGDILYEQENFKEATNIYIDALKYYPERYELYYNLGMTYTRLNDFQSAKEYYEQAAQINSLLYVANLSLAQIALMYNEKEEAKQYLMKIIQTQEEPDATAYYYLAYICALNGEKDKALQYLTEAIEEDESYYEKAEKQIVFQFIIPKIKRPNKNEKKENTKILTKKEQDAIFHLQEMYELVGNLNKKDIKELRITEEKNKESKEQEKE